MINKYLVSIFILLSIVSVVYTEDTTYCTVNTELEDTILFTSKGEHQHYDLTKYFQGFNLEFEFQLIDKEDDHPLLNYYSIEQGIQFKQESEQTDDYKIFIGMDFIIKSDGTGKFVVLAENMEGDLVVRYGGGTKTSTPFFKETIKIPYDNMTTCFGITLIDDDVAVVDCMQYQGGSTQHPYKNLYYITSKNGDHKEEFQVLNDNYNYINPFGRKTVKYQTTHNGINQIFLLCGIPFDLDEGDASQSYLNIFRYVTDDLEHFHNGHLQVNPPITGNSMGLFSTFLLADFDVLGDWIYVLDHNQGVIFFQYKHNEVVNIQYFLNKPQFHKERFGISVNYDGSIVQMLIAEASQIVEYHMYHVYDGPEETDSYRIENTLIGTVNMQSNADYFILEQGRLLTVYERGETNIDFIKGQIENAQAFHLWYSGNVYVFQTSHVTDYMIQKPALKVQPHQEEKQFKFLIKAKSTNFSASKECEISLYSHTIDNPASKEAYFTNNVNGESWVYQKSGFTTIPLEVNYAGPNINYDVGIIKPTDDKEKENKKFLGNNKTDDGDMHMLIYNEPRKVTFRVDEKDQVWRWTKVMPVFGSSNSFYSIHQDQNYDIVIYLCKPNLLNINNVICDTHVNEIKVGSPTTSMTFGTWGNNIDVLAIVDEKIPSYVYFYKMVETADDKPGDLWFHIDFNDIIDVNLEYWGKSNKIIDMKLQNNSLYTVIQDKTQRFIGISSYVESIEHRAKITGLDVAKWPHNEASFTWYPTKVYTNINHKNVIFVNNQQSVFVISTQNHIPSYLDVISIYSTIGVELFVCEHSFIIAQADTKIYDYSLEDLNWVSLQQEFKYQTYEYQFIEPFSIAASEYSGLIYVLATKINSSNLELLIYRSGVENIRTLYKVIDIEEEVTIDPEQPVTIDVGGMHEDYVFIQYNGKKVYVRSPRDPSVIVIPLVADSKEYVDLIPIEFTMKSWQGDNVIWEQDVSVVNSQTNVIYNYAHIAENLSDMYANDQENAEFDFDVDSWYEGSNMGFDIKCSPDPEICGDQIKIESMVSKNQDLVSDDYKDIIDLMDIYQKIYLLTFDPTNSQDFIIYHVSNDLKSSNKKVFGKIDSQKGKYECNFITPAYKDDGSFDYLITLCYDWKLETWATIKVHDQEKKKQDYFSTQNASDGEDFHYLLKIKDIKRGQYEYFHNELFLNNQSGDVYAGIYIFDLNDINESTIGSVTVKSNNQVQYINQHTFRDQAPQLEITSFYVTYETLGLREKDEHKYVKLFIVDSPTSHLYPPQLWFLNLDVTKQYKVDDEYTNRMNIRDFIINQELFINKYTQVKDIEIIAEQEKDKDGTDYIVYTCLLLTDNTAMYEIDLSFALVSSDLKDPHEFRLDRSQVKQIYNNYGISEPYPEIHFLGNTMAITYFNPFTKDITITLYDFITITQGPFGKYQRSQAPEDLEQLTPYKSNNLPLHTIKGGYKIKNVFGSVGLKFPAISFCLYQSPNGVGVLSNDLTLQNKMMALNYTPNHIKIKTSGKFEPQKVEFFAISDYVNPNEIAFSAEVSPGSFSPEDEDDDGGVSGWIIALCVILGLALLGGVGFFIWKKHYANNSSSQNIPLMKNDDLSDAGMSLQEPTKA